MMSSTEEISKENMLFHENRLYDGNIIKEEGYKGIIGNKGKPIKKKKEEEEETFDANVTRETFYKWLLIQHSKKKNKKVGKVRKGAVEKGKAMSKIKKPWSKKKNEEKNGKEPPPVVTNSTNTIDNKNKDVKTLKYNNTIFIELDQEYSFEKFKLKITNFKNENIKDLFAIDDVLNEYAHITQGSTINNNTLTIPYEKGINKEGKNLYDILLKLDLSNK